VFVDGIAVTTGFAVTGGGWTGTAYDTGEITFATAPTGTTLRIERNTTQTQALVHSANPDAEDYEQQNDKLTMIAQESSRVASRTVQQNDTDVTEDVQLPAKSVRANKLLGFSSTGALVAAEVGLSQTVPPQFITLDAGQTDYALTLPAGETVSASDLLIDVSGWNLHSNTDYTVLNGSAVHLLIDLTEMDGYEMQVRIVSGAGIFGQVADGAVNSPAKFANRPVDSTVLATGAIDDPDKFSNRPVDNTVLAIGTPLGVLGYDAAGLPVVVTRKYVGEAWTWDGAAENLPAGNILHAGQTLSATTFPELFAIYGYRHGGSGNAFNLPNPAARLEVYVGQGLTAEGGGLGTARMAGATGGKEVHTQLPGEVGQHTHPAQPGGAGSTSGVTDGGPASLRLLPTSAATQPNAGPPTAMPIMPPWFCAGYRAVHTGRADHDYLGNIL